MLAIAVAPTAGTGAAALVVVLAGRRRRRLQDVARALLWPSRRDVPAPRSGAGRSPTLQAAGPRSTAGRVAAPSRHGLRKDNAAVVAPDALAGQHGMGGGPGAGQYGGEPDPRGHMGFLTLRPSPLAISAVCLVYLHRCTAQPAATLADLAVAVLVYVLLIVVAITAAVGAARQGGPARVAVAPKAARRGPRRVPVRGTVRAAPPLPAPRHAIDRPIALSLPRRVR